MLGIALYGSIVVAQEVIDVPVEYDSVAVYIDSLDFVKADRINSIIATSSIDLLTAEKILYEQDNTKAITDRLDIIIDLLQRKL